MNQNPNQQETTMHDAPNHNADTIKSRKSLIAPPIFMALYMAIFAVFALTAVISRDGSLFACSLTGFTFVLMHGRWKVG